MSKSNLNIRFYLRTNHVNKDGTCAIMGENYRQWRAHGIQHKAVG